MTADAILEQLDKVRRTGAGRWVARCPGHEDGRPSLSIRELEDGRVLLHDFGGCSVEQVLAAMNLTITDLFPVPLTGHAPRVRRPFSAADVLAVLDTEMLVVMVTASDMAEGRPINRDRLRLAAQRISAAIEVAHGR